jgi:hypothetical protein
LARPLRGAWASNELRALVVAWRAEGGALDDGGD